jgi:hypothetical protein
MLDILLQQHNAEIATLKLALAKKDIAVGDRTGSGAGIGTERGKGEGENVQSGRAVERAAGQARHRRTSARSCRS